MARRKQVKVEEEGPSLFGLKLSSPIAVLLAVVLTLIVFTPTFSNDFTNWDDPGYVTENPLIKPGGASLGEIFSLKTIVVGNYHPLTLLSLKLDYLLSGDEPVAPFWFHFTNLLLHLLNVVLVYFLVFFLFKRNWVLAFGSAVFFGIHPMHVESVAWISERKDVLYGFFFLAGLLVYAKGEVGNVKKLFPVFIFFVLSLLSKPAAVVFPLVLLLIDYLKERKWGLGMVVEKLPFFVLSVIIGMITIKAQGSALTDASQFSGVQKLCFASYGLMAYIVKLILPTSLSALYPYPIFSSAESLPPLFMLAPVGLIGMIVFLALKFRDNREAIFGFFFYVVNLVLVLQVISVGNAIMADRYTYLPSIGLFIFLTYFLRWLFGLLRRGKSQVDMVVPIFGLLATIIWSALAFQQCKVWKNSDTLWTQAIENCEPNGLASLQRGMYFYTTGNAKKAIRDFTNVTKDLPSYHKGYSRRAQVYLDTNELDKAEKDFNKALSIFDGDYELWNSRGHLNYKRENFEAAIADYNKSIQLNGNFKKSLMNRAIVYHRQGKYEQALEGYDAALRLDPNYKAAKGNRELLLKTMNGA